MLHHAVLPKIESIPVDSRWASWASDRYASMWLAHTSAFETIVAAWDEVKGRTKPMTIMAW